MVDTVNNDPLEIIKAEPDKDVVVFLERFGESTPESAESFKNRTKKMAGLVNTGETEDEAWPMEFGDPHKGRFELVGGEIMEYPQGKGPDGNPLPPKKVVVYRVTSAVEAVQSGGKKDEGLVPSGYMGMDSLRQILSNIGMLTLDGDGRVQKVDERVHIKVVKDSGGGSWKEVAFSLPSGPSSFDVNITLSEGNLNSALEDFERNKPEMAPLNFFKRLDGTNPAPPKLVVTQFTATKK